MPSYQTLTIVGGQSGYIPKNAIIIGINTTLDGQAESDCINLDDVEIAQCYVFKWFSSIPNNSNVTINIESFYGTGLLINDVLYPFGEDVLLFDAANAASTGDHLMTVISNTAATRGLISDMCYFNQTDDQSRRGSVFYLIFKTFPSIGDDLKLVGYGSDANTFGQIPIEIPAQTLEELSTAGDTTTLCGCASEVAA